MSKKGQITLLFVLILVVATLVIGIYFLESGAIRKINLSAITKTIGLSDEKDEAEDYVLGCANKVGIDALLLLGLQGGDMGSEKYVDVGGARVSYGYYDGKNVMPDTSETKTDVGDYYEYFLPTCINSFNLSRLKAGNLSTTVDIEKNLVSIFIRYPIEMEKKGTKIFLKENYNVAYKIRLGEMMSIANKILDKDNGNDTAIDMDYIYSLGNEFNVNIGQVGNDRIYMISDSKNKLGRYNYTFMFAEHYGEGTS